MSGKTRGFQPRSLRAMTRNALRPHYLPVMARKVMARLRPSHREDAIAWAAARALPAATIARTLDPELWDETTEWAERFRAYARGTLATLGVTLGGGGHFALVYFLVRYLQPAVALETGVSAGWTSQAILAAMERNGTGRLFSSDFPYFRLDEPERYIGCLVEARLRDGWRLEISGDRINLPRLLDEAGVVDFVHYDSEKSAEGRSFAIELMRSHLGPNAVTVMDDIDDNAFFRDWAETSDRACTVVERGRKYVGILGLGVEAPRDGAAG
ncbi:MAG TPA: class I SAM-dependent methyltransferase [Acidimicrobiia bacterium]|nr:class I SAM-dependent methyltransferase [Acidimicrobiia bacterium]